MSNRTVVLHRRLLTLCATIFLGACDGQMLAPLRPGSVTASARPGGPSFSASPVSANQINLSWIDGSRNETGWEVHRSTAGAAGAFTRIGTLGVDATWYNDSGLASDTEYCYKVRWFRTKGGPGVSFGEFSNVVCARTLVAPAAPSGVSAVPPNSRTVHVRWIDNASNETQMRVDRAAGPGGPWGAIASLPANSTAYDNFLLAPDQQVCYRIAAVNQNGESVSEPDCTTPPQQPALVSVTASGSAIDVVWSDLSVAEDGYEILRRVDGTNFSSLVTLPANTSSYRDAAPPSDVRVWYVVRALKDGGFSYESGTAWAAISTGPPPAVAVNATPSGSTAALIYWGSVLPTAISVRVERSSDGVSGWELAASITDLEYPGFQDSGRTPEQRVCYRAYAINSFGESPASNVDCTIPLAAASDFRVIGNEDGSVTATWTDNSNHEEGYLLPIYYCYPDWGCEYYYDLWLPPNTTSAVTWPFEYVWDVVACGDGGCSDPASLAGNGVTSQVGGLRAGETTPRTSDPVSRASQLRERIKAARRPMMR